MVRFVWCVCARARSKLQPPEFVWMWSKYVPQAFKFWFTLSDNELCTLHRKKIEWNVDAIRSIQLYQISSAKCNGPAEIVW